jgi:hypothetical protein
VKPLFTLGRLVATSGALAAIEKSGQQPGEFLLFIAAQLFILRLSGLGRTI